MAHTFDSKAQTTQTNANPVTLTDTIGATVTLTVLMIMQTGITTAGGGSGKCLRQGGNPTCDGVEMLFGGLANGAELGYEGNAEIWFLVNGDIPSGASKVFSVPNDGVSDISLNVAHYIASGGSSYFDETGSAYDTTTSSVGVTKTAPASGDVSISAVFGGFTINANNRTLLYNETTSGEGVRTQYHLSTDTSDIEHTFGTSFNADLAMVLVNFSETASNTPTVVLDTADAEVFGSENPKLDLTATDIEGDDIDYEIEISDQSDFGLTLLTSYPLADATGGGALGTGSRIKQGQSFAGSNDWFSRCAFFLAPVGSPTGNVYTELWSHDGGTFGSTGEPDVLLATSRSIDALDVLGGWYVVFEFNTSIKLSAGTNYFVTVTHDNHVAGNYFTIRSDSSSPTHAGNTATWNGSTWTADSTRDSAFRVETGFKGSYRSIDGDSGFANEVTPGDTRPFTEGEAGSYTVQSGEELITGTTWYWRSRAKDPSGTNIYGIWSASKNFTTSVSSRQRYFIIS